MCGLHRPRCTLRRVAAVRRGGSCDRTTVGEVNNCLYAELVGTPKFMDPEYLLTGIPQPSVDFYSFGCMVTGYDFQRKKYTYKSRRC